MQCPLTHSPIQVRHLDFPMEVRNVFHREAHLGLTSLQSYKVQNVYYNVLNKLYNNATSLTHAESLRRCHTNTLAITCFHDCLSFLYIVTAPPRQCFVIASVHMLNLLLRVADRRGVLLRVCKVE